MHKLQRGIAPACLVNYQHGKDNWSAVSSADKTEIWQELQAMQGTRCAYCERTIDEQQRHIEHFFKKSRTPQTTFKWENLFGSCNNQKSCGRHKDSCGPYAANDLLKPDIDDPEEFLVFVSDGTIFPRDGLNAIQRRKAEETLRVFNLDAQRGPLRQMRQAMATSYLQTAEELWSLRDQFSEKEWQELLDAELAAVEHLNFVTVIRNILCRTSHSGSHKYPRKSKFLP